MIGEQTLFISLAELIGKTGALNLCEQFGGQTLYIRKVATLPEGVDRHWSDYFGPDAYERLVKRMGGERVYIPMAPPELLLERDTAIFVRLNAGESAADIARDFRLTTHSVHNIYSRVDRSRQGQQPGVQA